MASVGTKFTMILKGETTGNKTVNVNNPNDSITAALVNTFVDEYEGVYSGDTWALGTCYYEDVTHRAISNN